MEGEREGVQSDSPEKPRNRGGLQSVLTVRGGKAGGGKSHRGRGVKTQKESEGRGLSALRPRPLNESSPKPPACSHPVIRNRRKKGREEEEGGGVNWAGQPVARRVDSWEAPYVLPRTESVKEEKMARPRQRPSEKNRPSIVQLGGPPP